MSIPTIPEGWSFEDLDDDVSLLKNASAMCTLDWKKRGFRFGLVRTGKLNSTKEYTGRGWKERLLEDAIGALGALR